MNSTPAPARDIARCTDCATRDRCVIGSLPQAAAGFGAALRERSFAPGEVLLREGHRTSHFRIVKLGTAFICRSSHAGEMRPLAIASRGMPFGLGGFLKQPNQVSLVAASSGRYCELAVEALSTLSRSDPAFRARLDGALNDNFGLLARWAEAVGRKSVVSRVAAGMRLLAEDQKSSTVVIPSHAALARLFGTTRETVARAFASLEADGCLVRQSSRRCDLMAPRLAQWLDANA